MQIIGEEIPLTNGEVFAILRRNRDMRYAKSLPAFGIQSRNLVSNTPQASRPPKSFQNRAQASREAAQRALQDFGAQNAVALQEVKGLFYLIASRDCYGVSSVYSSKFQPQVTAAPLVSSAAMNEAKQQQNNDDVSAYFAVSGFGAVGSIRHQLAVHKELEVLEKQGRAKELDVINAVSKVARQHSHQHQRVLVNAATPSSPSSSSVASHFQLTEREVRNLLAVRPKHEAAVYAVLTNLETRLSTEEAASALATDLARVFNANNDEA
ncbi:Hypothetical protein, putative [Bodo saltans]|uniref:Uncharacterized protein n=1 Tax=Bodo saltans TaxID=75058 RepID=A0A0S4J054_BODSA|nr:Hypothetical protein, putative [Bodo saltans]|eukprot:CUG35264.1 Hypothetical protein, putative [Bodo saltans]